MKTLKVSLSTNGIRSLIRELEKFKSDLAEKEDMFMQLLASRVEASLMESYNGKPVEVTTERFNDGDMHGYIVRASGEALGFIEFGTGVYAGYGDNPFADEMPFKVYPGSWSEWHERTYQEWVENGRKGRYPYNHYPTNALPKAYNELVVNAHTLAREIFGGGH